MMSYSIGTIFKFYEFRKKSDLTEEKRYSSEIARIDSFQTWNEHNSSEIDKALFDEQYQDDSDTPEGEVFKPNHKFMSNFERIERPNHEIKVSQFTRIEEEKRMFKANEVAHNKSDSTAHTSGFQSILINNSPTSKSMNYDKGLTKINLSGFVMPIIDEEESGHMNTQSFQVTRKIGKNKINDYDGSQSCKSQSFHSSLAANIDKDGYMVNVKRSKG